MHTALMKGRVVAGVRAYTENMRFLYLVKKCFLPCRVSGEAQSVCLVQVSQKNPDSFVIFFFIDVMVDFHRLSYKHSSSQTSGRNVQVISASRSPAWQTRCLGLDVSHPGPRLDPAGEQSRAPPAAGSPTWGPHPLRAATRQHRDSAHRWLLSLVLVPPSDRSLSTIHIP